MSDKVESGKIGKKRLPYVRIALGIVFIVLIVGFILSLPHDLTDSTRASINGHYIQIEGGMVRYDLAGNDGDPTVVLVNGFPLPYEVWDRNAEFLTSHGYRVLRYDLFGYGFSDRPVGNYDVLFYEKQLINLLSSLNISGPIILVGHSISAPIVSTYALAHKEQVQRLILIAPHYSALVIPFIDNKAMASMLEYLVPKGVAGFAEGFFYSNKGHEQLKKVIKKQADFNGFGRASIEIAKNFHSKTFTDLYKKLGDNHFKTLLIWGELDWQVPYVEGCDKIASITDAKVVRVPFTVHLPQYERPDAVNKAIYEFIRESKLKTGAKVKK